jgi:putative oxidoreductase
LLPAAAGPGSVVSVDHVDLGLFVIRLGFGLMLTAHGVNKIKGGLKGTAGWFGSMGMRPPMVHAAMAATTEIGAGLFFAAGFLTPLAAAAIIATMVVAWITAHRKNGFFVFKPGQGWEYVAMIAVAAFGIGAIGAGRISIDHALDWDVEGKGGALIAGLVGVGSALLLLAACWRPPKPKAAE